MSSTWADLFDRADSHEVSIDDIRAALSARREDD